MSSLELVIHSLWPILSPVSFYRPGRRGGQCSKVGGLLWESTRGPQLGNFVATLAWEGLCPPFSFFAEVQIVIYSPSPPPTQLARPSVGAWSLSLGERVHSIGQYSPGRWYWLWLNDAFESYMRKYLGELSIGCCVPQNVRDTPSGRWGPFPCSPYLGLGYPSSSPSFCAVSTAHLCSLRKQTTQSRFTVTLPVHHSVFRRLMDQGKKYINTLLSIVVLLAFENQPTFFSLWSEK